MKRWINSIMALSAFLAAIGAIFLFIEDFRFWAWASETREIGSIAYQNALNEAKNRKLDVEFRLYNCQKNKDDCNYWKSQIERIEEEIKRLERKRKKFLE